ncbi:MAG: DUF1670 domain-containing protein [Actinomycetota bacterium]|nr:DUF1670 domain-containing protein [Actinomycetota bacterium]
MEFGKIEYTANGSGRQLKLTLIDHGDNEVLDKYGITELRRRRAVRLANEASEQGVLLSYFDLSCLLLCSLATLKRDIAFLEGRGAGMPLKGRRKNTPMKNARTGVHEI